MSYALQGTGACQDLVQNSSECFTNAPPLLNVVSVTEHSVSDTSKPSGCSTVVHEDGSADLYFNTASGTACGVAGSTASVIAFASSVINVTVALAKAEAADAATITLVGPADKWFGIGFGTDSMCLHQQSEECPGGGPYAIVILGDGAQNVTERKLGYHGPGDLLGSSVTVKSNTVQNNVRTVVVTRSLKGLSDKYYTFDPTKESMKFINAMGCGLTFAQHCGHAPGVLNFLAVEEPTCVCQAGIRGSIGGNSFPYPTPCGDALVEQHNPICYVQTYTGGIGCCRHGQSLLDADQEVPWPEDYLEYQLKFRFYFEEYVPATPSTAASHEEVVRIWMDTERFAGEYDIVQCLPGTAPSQCIFELTGKWQIADMMQDCSMHGGAGFPCTGIGSTDPSKTAGVQLIHIAPHCHAPTCISMELYHADTGLLLCHADAVLGQGSGESYDEKDYMTLPPCLFGDPDSEGLPAPILLPLDAKLLAVTRHNNTYAHTGQMTHWQMRGVVVPRTFDAETDGRRFEKPSDLDAFERRERGRGLSEAVLV